MTEVANLRLKGSMQGEGGHFNFKDLYYISCHTLEGADVTKYGKTRLQRELIDLWLGVWSSRQRIRAFRNQQLVTHQPLM